MLWFGVSVMDDGFVYNIHHSSLTYPSRIVLSWKKLTGYKST